MTDVQRGMQPKTVKREIKKKLEDWASTIDDPEVKKLVEKDTIVTGGSIASMLMGERVNDFDIYFRTYETTLAVAHYYVKKFNETSKYGGTVEVREEKRKNIKGGDESRIIIYVPSAGIAGENPDDEEDQAQQAVDDNAEDEGRYRPVFMSENAITLSDKVQLVTRFWGSPDQVHKSFDFVHATCYYVWKSRELITPVEALQSMMSRTLKYRGSYYPVASIWRCRKFMDRGWKISAGELLKIMWQISELDLTDPGVLYEQLTGVDFLYMRSLLNILEHYKGNNGDRMDIDSTYVIGVIDEIFG